MGCSTADYDSQDEGMVYREYPQKVKYNHHQSSDEEEAPKNRGRTPAVQHFFLHVPAPYHPSGKKAPKTFFKECGGAGLDHFSKSSYFCDWR
jgi:hypothetical protein